MSGKVLDKHYGKDSSAEKVERLREFIRDIYILTINIFTNKLDFILSMAGVTTIILNGLLVVTGLVGGYVSRILYQRRVRPVLDSNEKVYSKPIAGVPAQAKQGHAKEFELFTKRETYFLEIANRGLNSATNVKAHLVLDGVTKLEENLPELRLALRTPLRWSEANRPSATEINPDETIGLEILNVQNQDLPTETTVPEQGSEMPSRVSSIEVPAEDEPVQRALSGGDRFEAPHFAISSESDEEIPPAVHNLSWTPRQFSEIDWQTSQVEITADNVGKLVQPLKISEASGDLEIEAAESA